jgi:hypothetical protein
VTDPIAAVQPPDPFQQPRRWRVYTRPLRTSHDFRMIWWSGLISYLGSITTYVAVPFQIKQLTGSLALAGLLGLVELVPLIVFGLWGGALADARDRKTMVFGCEGGLSPGPGWSRRPSVYGEPSRPVGRWRPPGPSP